MADEIEKDATGEQQFKELLDDGGQGNAPSQEKSTRTGKYRQVLLTVFVTPVMISLAHMLSYPALMVPQLQNLTQNDQLFMTEDDGAWYTSVNSLWAPLGSLIAGVMMDRFGRKITLAVPLIPTILAWIVTACAQSHAVLYVFRVFLGILGGFGPPICQIYLAECADSEFRGFTINVGYVSPSFGFLLTFTLGALMDWRLLAWCGLIFPLITLFGLLILPESPLWLLRNGRTEEAYQNLLWLRGSPQIARNELNESFTRFKRENEVSSGATSWRDFFRPSVLKPIVIIFAFILFFNLTGSYLLIYYAIDILKQVELHINVNIASIMLSFVRLIVTIGFCWLFMKVKRRKIYLIAGIGSTFSTLILSAYLEKQHVFHTNKFFDSFAAGALFITYVATNSGFMIAPGFLTGELLPAKIRGRLAVVIYTYFSVVTFVLNKYFSTLKTTIGLPGVLLVFGVASLLTTALIYFLFQKQKANHLSKSNNIFERMVGFIIDGPLKRGLKTPIWNRDCLKKG